MVLEGLDILDLNQEYVSRLSRLDLERPRQIVDFCQVDVLHIIGAIIVLDLAARPIEALNLNNFTILNGSAEGHWHSVSIGCQCVEFPYHQGAIYSEQN